MQVNKIFSHNNFKGRISVPLHENDRHRGYIKEDDFGADKFDKNKRRYDFDTEVITDIGSYNGGLAKIRLGKNDTVYSLVNLNTFLNAYRCAHNNIFLTVHCPSREAEKQGNK